MQASRILQIVRNRWSSVTACRDEAPEPLDHPSLRDMSPQELADLPLERWELADLPLERWELAQPRPPLEAAACEKGRQAASLFKHDGSRRIV
ncbi:hypothetical protein GCM10007874_61470 [Labrys miyagiensis]|uniref:Uncharacterized protein n=1 Tax=Labrys miyagiensis TaxID=346912 RepID=A0ABQ6CXY2_9HYPH|nr:hypothetical protein [Labrys miyagiensis]GLS23127.1 hypothetical protein GCM10007874_61470 [Labrys miyagiensis]